MFQRLQPPVVELAVLWKKISENWSRPIPSIGLGRQTTTSQTGQGDSNDLGLHVRHQMTPANRNHYYPDSLLFVSADFLPRVSSRRLNLSSTRPQIRYVDDRTVHNSCSFRWRATYVRIQGLPPSIPAQYVPETSPVEE